MVAADQEMVAASPAQSLLVTSAAKNHFNLVNFDERHLTSVPRLDNFRQVI
jgi:hypothetical protein